MKYVPELRLSSLSPFSVRKLPSGHVKLNRTTCRCHLTSDYLITPWLDLPQRYLTFEAYIKAPCSLSQHISLITSDPSLTSRLLTVTNVRYCYLEESPEYIYTLRYYH